MPHSADHDPLREYERCWICHKAVDVVLADIAPDIMTIGPAEIIRRLRRALLEVVA
jgi:hypothetical protein